MLTWLRKRRKNKEKEKIDLELDDNTCSEEPAPQETPVLSIVSTRGLITLGDTFGEALRLDVRSVPEKMERYLREVSGSREESCSVRSVALIHAGLQACPRRVQEFHNLTSLLLSHNDISQVPAFLVCLTHLRVLDLSFNQLTSLPSSLGNVPSLQDLNFRNNALTSLPTTILHLTQLRTIDLRANNMTSPPQAICDQGKGAILESLRTRLSRGNEWANWSPCPEQAGGSDQGPRSLLALAAKCILDHQLDFQASSLPAAAKAFLQKKTPCSRPGLYLSRCDRCHRYFSTAENFRDHHC